MSILNRPSIQSFKGCLTGLALGDALGAPFEGLPPGNYRPDCRSPLIYTDDTEMMINLARALTEVEEPSTATIARYFAEGLNPERGYGEGALRVLGLVREGMAVERAVRAVFPEGSYGNGAAMRVAPVGLLYWQDEERIKEMVERSAHATHVHPLAVEGAMMIALSIGYILRGGERTGLIEYLLGRAETEEFRGSLRKCLSSVLKGIDEGWVVKELGNSVAAHRSVPAAVYSFVMLGDDFMGLVRFCVSLGGDTDTISAMAGALSGALLGMEGLPVDCIRRLEHQALIESLAERLYDKATG
ncbi:MAG: hypothetical protein D6710_09835 [Nitrospirae bacterium]|nr:MAG: hypothetical protein D6710_09835 [Nitrospirota bacterium]